MSNYSSPHKQDHRETIFYTYKSLAEKYGEQVESSFLPNEKQFVSLVDWWQEPYDLFGWAVRDREDYMAYILPEQYVGINDERDPRQQENRNGKNPNKGMIDRLKRDANLRGGEFHKGECDGIIRYRFACNSLNPGIINLDTCGEAKSGGKLMGNIMRECDSWKPNGFIMIALNIVSEGRFSKVRAEQTGDFLTEEYPYWNYNWEQHSESYTYRGSGNGRYKMTTLFFYRKKKSKMVPDDLSKGVHGKWWKERLKEIAEEFFTPQERAWFTMRAKRRAQGWKPFEHKLAIIKNRRAA